MFNVSFATMQGKYHKSKDIACQDKTAYHATDSSVCIALSDGAGSCEHSDIGAECTCACISKYIAENFDYCYNTSDDMLKIKLKDIIISELVKCGYPIYEMSCTLLFYAETEDRYICGHIGDGIVFETNDNGCRVLSLPENGEMDNITFFVTDTTNEHFKITKAKANTNKMILMTSDGCGRLLYNEKTNEISDAVNVLSSWFVELDNEKMNQALKNNLLVSFSSMTNDDMSLIILKRG